MTLSEIVEEVKHGNFLCAYDNNQVIQSSIMEILNIPDKDIKDNPSDLQDLVDLITIGNITYNYSDSDVLPIDDGMYDLLVVKLQRVDYDKFTPGSIPVDIAKINSTYKAKIDKDDKIVKPFTIMADDDRRKLDESLYPSILNYTKPFDSRSYLYKPFYVDDESMYINKRIRDVSHNYPQLVGTLEKCTY